MRRLWTEEEINFLKENYDILSVKEISIKLNRTIDAVKNKLKKYHLRVTAKWNQNNLNKLKILFLQKISIKDISKIFNCTEPAIKAQLGKLGLQTKQHKLSNTNIFNRYHKMRERCCNPNCEKYYCYGGRGITICDEWLNSVESFYNWAINNGYEKNLWLDRIDNDGNYSPENCRWITQKEQANNKRNNVKITAFGETKTLTQWSRDERCMVGRTGLRLRISKGFSPEDAITLPPMNNL